MANRNGFSSQYDYEKSRVQERGFASIKGYQEEKAKQRGCSSRRNYTKRLADRKGFSSQYDYEKSRVQERGFSSYADYVAKLIRSRGFNSISQYQLHLAKKNGRLAEFLIKRRLRQSVRQSLIRYANGETIQDDQGFNLSFNEIAQSLLTKMTDLGISVEQLKQYHIDHIIPLAFYQIPNELIKAFHPANLRIIPSKENCSKKHRLTQQTLEIIIQLPQSIYPDNPEFRKLLNSNLE